MKNINIEDKNKFLLKNKTLLFAKEQLKSEFVGLDDVIDELIELIEPWYLFPNGQLRPQVINLFGMTGTGKTSLINRLFSILEMTSIIKFDTGEWVDKSDYQLSQIISSQFQKTDNDKNRPILIFDEFQLGRTITQDYSDIDRPNLRVIWELLDTGKFLINEDNWQSYELQTLYNKLNILIKNGLTARYGKITSKIEEWKVYFNQDVFTDEEKNHIIENYTIDALIPPNLIYILNELSTDFLSETEIKKYILTLETERDILTFVEKILVSGNKPVEYDFSDSIIFIIGNLDSAYGMSHNMDADVDADMLYEYTKKITITDIKNALSELYRPEQISRLGNSYLIYKSFSEDSYKKLIELELNKIIKKIKVKFDINIVFSETTKSLIYKEGVFASQGVRPIFSTITTLIETKIGKIVVDILKKDIIANDIYWDTNKQKTKFIIIINNKEKIEYKLNLKVDNLRKSKKDDIQALVGVHESGHVLCHVFAMNICPIVAVSKTINTGGFTRTETPDFESKQLLEQKLISLLGGYVAEKLIFGKENLTNGSFSDLQKTTELSLSIVKEYGMNGIPLQYAKSDFRVSNISVDDTDLDKVVEQIVKDAVKKTTEILTENIELLVEMGKYLTYNSKIDEKQIKRMVKKYGKWKVEKYKTKDTYYDYKNILMNYKK